MPIEKLRLTTIAATIILVTAAQAAASGFHPASLAACQASVRSTADNADCYETEIKKLARRLPPGSTAWMAKMQSACQAKYAQDGTGGEGEAQDCRLQALASKVGAR
jgi:uncharacterized protein YecT (DUF1311 family)